MSDPTPAKNASLAEPFGSPLGRALRSGLDTDPAFGAVVPPIYLSTNYAFTSPGEQRGFDYSRSGNPTRNVLGEAIATLEGGADAVITGTGMSAISLVLISMLRVGDTVVVPHDAYGGSWRLFHQLAAQGLFSVETVDLTDTAAAVARIGEVEPAMVWIETPSNPLLRLTDLDPVIAAAHDSDAIAVVDNTFCSPLLLRPIEFGADVVVHSSTKYLNGHSDVLSGAAVGASEAVAGELKRWANVLGVTASAFDSYLVMRGLRTIDARMRVHQENAAAIAEFLVPHPAVAAVHYPGLTAHPHHELAKRQQAGFGAMITLELADGRASVDRFVRELNFFTLAESLGGTESLVAHPATMTHASMTDEAKAHAGITDGMLRLSVGIEPTEDLLADLAGGLNRLYP